MNSLVIQTSFLGDLVLTTPLLAELAKCGPVDVVVTPAGAPLLANHPAVRDVIVFDKRGRDNGAVGLVRFGRSLRMRADGSKRAIEKAFLAQGSMRSAVLARLSGAGETVGFDTSAGRALYSRRVHYQSELHHAERLWRLAAADSNDIAASPTAETLHPSLYPGEKERQAVDAFLGDTPQSAMPLLALAPGSIWGTKRWPGYAALASRLASRYRLVVVGGADDKPLAVEIVRAVTNESAAPVLDSTGRLSLLASAELIRRCVALVTNDSLPQHLASAVGTRTLSIFGPTVPAMGFGPLAARHATAGLSNLSCRPCSSHGPMTCPLGHFRCMRDLAVGDIERELVALLS